MVGVAHAGKCFQCFGLGPPVLDDVSGHGATRFFRIGHFGLVCVPHEFLEYRRNDSPVKRFGQCSFAVFRAGQVDDQSVCSRCRFRVGLLFPKTRTDLVFLV